MIEDMTKYDGETDHMVDAFISDYNRRVEESKKRNPEGKADHYTSLKWAVFRTFGGSLLHSAFFAFLGECTVIAFTTYMIVIIDYLKDEVVPRYMGYVHAVIFSALMIASVICKNESQIIGFKNSVAIRKSLTAAMYTKISKLSMRSLTETNSGKLITIVSGDLQQVTQMMHLVSFLIAAPFVNLVAFIVLGTTGPWSTAAITGGIWFIILVL